MYILGMNLTVISYVIFWISRFCKNKKNMLLFDNISRILAILSFLILHTLDGVKNTIFVIIRNFFGQYLENKKFIYKFIVFCFLLITMFVMFLFDFSGISTIFIIICAFFNLFGVIFLDAQGVRLFGIIGSVFYNAFLFCTKNYAGSLCETICMFVMLISLLKYRKLNQKEKLRSC